MMRIRAFPIEPIDEKSAVDICTFLKTAIQKILKKKGEGLSAEELYRNAYTLVLHKRGDILYNGVKEVIREHLVKEVQVDILNSLNDNFLQTLNQAWNDYQTTITFIRDHILMYMDRVYVVQNNLDNVYNLGLNLFRDNVVYHASIRDHLKNTFITEIENERYGKAIDRTEINNACKMLMKLESHLVNREIVTEIFELFLEKIEEYSESKSLLFKNDHLMYTHEYVKNVRQYVNEEIERAKIYLPESSEVRIRNVIENIMLYQNMEILIERTS